MPSSFGTFHLEEEEIGDHFSSEEKCQIQVTKFYFQSILLLIYYYQNIGSDLGPGHLLSLSIYANVLTLVLKNSFANYV